MKSNANALLFIFPKILANFGRLENLINEIQTLLCNFSLFYLDEQTLYIPVYFIYETEEINQIVNILKNDHKQISGEEKKDILSYLGLNQNLLHFSLSASDPRKIETLNLENLSGYLEGDNSSGTQNPIIAIVANYDNLSIAPVLINFLTKI